MEPPSSLLPELGQSNTWGLFVTGNKLDFGWDMTSRKHGPHLFVRKLSVLGFRNRYPVSEEGWRQAWLVLVQEEPATAVKLRQHVEEERRRKSAAKQGKTPAQLELELDLKRRGSGLGRVYRDLTVVGGYGWSPSAGTRVTVGLGSDRLIIASVPLTEPITIKYKNLLSFEFLGGAVTTGGGFFGGGFGVKGAVEGMVVASVLNALTTKTKVNSLVRISGRDGETVLHVANQMPATLRSWFAPAVNAVSAANSPTTRHDQGMIRPEQDDVVAKLERLAALHDAGHLTDDEFGAAKAALLGSV
jgi:hypothetical protein